VKAQEVEIVEAGFEDAVMELVCEARAEGRDLALRADDADGVTERESGIAGEPAPMTMGEGRARRPNCRGGPVSTAAARRQFQVIGSGCLLKPRRWAGANRYCV
jgi:hypothetical protein